MYYTIRGKAQSDAKQGNAVCLIGVQKNSALWAFAGKTIDSDVHGQQLKKIITTNWKNSNEEEKASYSIMILPYLKTGRIRS